MCWYLAQNSKHTLWQRVYVFLGERVQEACTDVIAVTGKFGLVLTTWQGLAGGTRYRWAFFSPSGSSLDEITTLVDSGKVSLEETMKPHLEFLHLPLVGLLRYFAA